jgi:hypothetical protein
MKLKGVLPEVKPLKPGPPKLPITFCAPCATKIVASPRRMGMVAQVEEVAIRLRDILIASRYLVEERQDINREAEKDETQGQGGIIYHK